MKRALAPLVFLLLSGCSHSPPVVPGPPTGPYLVDPEDPQFDGPYDILEAFVQELNGSFVVMVHFRNFRASDGNFTLPRAEVQVELERDGRREWFYAGNKPNFSRAPPHVSYAMGVLENGARRELAEICAEHTSSAPEPPFMIRMEFPNEHTGLDAGGGLLLGVRVTSGDFEGAAFDEGRFEQRASLRGGPNPHDTCPLVAERPR